MSHVLARTCSATCSASRARRSPSASSCASAAVTSRCAAATAAGVAARVSSIFFSSAAALAASSSTRDGRRVDSQFIQFIAARAENCAACRSDTRRARGAPTPSPARRSPTRWRRLLANTLLGAALLASAAALRVPTPAPPAQPRCGCCVAGSRRVAPGASAALLGALTLDVGYGRRVRRAALRALRRAAAHAPPPCPNLTRAARAQTLAAAPELGRASPRLGPASLGRHRALPDARRALVVPTRTIRTSCRGTSPRGPPSRSSSRRALVPPVAGVDVSPLIWVGILTFLSEILVGPQGILSIIERKG